MPGRVFYSTCKESVLPEHLLRAKELQKYASRVAATPPKQTHLEKRSQSGEAVAEPKLPLQPAVLSLPSSSHTPHFHQFRATFQTSDTPRPRPAEPSRRDRSKAEQGHQSMEHAPGALQSGTWLALPGPQSQACRTTSAATNAWPLSAEGGVLSGPWPWPSG